MTTTKPGKAAATKPVPPSTYQSGFCSLGSHEGTQPTSPSGKPLRTCPVGGRFNYPSREGGPVTCMCECHTPGRELEEITGVKFPVFDSRKASSATGGILSLYATSTGPDGKQRPGVGNVDRPSVVTASGVRFNATPTGRAAPGQLEEEVRSVISAQVKAAGEDMIAMLGLIPETISKAVAAVRKETDGPSTGAIYAILKRWDGAAMVELGEKPFRFIRFTDKGKRDLLR